MIMEPIISLTTIPQRIHRIEECIQSLKNQGLPIHVFLPKYPKRADEIIHTIPDFLGGCHVHWVEDEGSITKLRPALREGFQEIITADDDIEYPPGWAGNLIRWSYAYPHAVVAHRGRQLDPHRPHKYKGVGITENVSEPTQVNLVTGVRGVMYKRQFFSQQFIDSTEFTTVDDIDISVELNNNGVPIMVVPRQGPVRALTASHIDRLAMHNGKGGDNVEMLEKKGFWQSLKNMKDEQ